MAKKLTEKQDSLFSYIEGIRRVFRAKYFKSNQDKIIKNIERFSSFGQLQSKLWLIDILKEKKLLNLGDIFLCAGWYGLLAFFLLHDKKLAIKRVFNFEIDPLSVSISEDLNRNFVQKDWKFKATWKDILELNYQQDRFETLKANGEAQTLIVSPDTIINTSCEHISNFPHWWNKLPQKKLIILQSNDFFQHEDHNNCVSSLEKFKKQAPLELLYEGNLKFERYQRFMLIGYKN